MQRIICVQKECKQLERTGCHPSVAAKFRKDASLRTSPTLPLPASHTSSLAASPSVRPASLRPEAALTASLSCVSASCLPRRRSGGRARTSGVRRRSDERARCLNDSERLRSRAARASGCSGASSFPCRWVSTLSRILSHRVAAWTCSVYSLLRDESILPPLQGCGKTFAVISGSVCSVFTVQKRHTTDIHNSWHRNIPLRTTK